MTDDYQDAKSKVLAALKAAAPRSLTTWDLISLTRHSRAAGRVWELIHEDGYQIEHTNEGRIHYWRYKADPVVHQASLFQERSA